MWWFSHDLLRVVIPFRCVACDQISSALLCSICALSANPFPRGSCAGCGARSKPHSGARSWGPCARCDVLSGTSISGIHISWEYGGSIAQALRAAKLGSRIDRATSMGALGGVNPPPEWLLEDVDVVVPVPPSPDRLRRVGFDVVTEFASVWARCLERPLLTGAVARKRGASQTRLSPLERRDSARSNFTAGHRPDCVRGKRVLLVDDIRTTGATLSAVSLLLEAQGVSGCVAWVLCGHNAPE